MIDDPILWKSELVKIGDRLEAKTKQKRWTDRTGYLIEQDFIASAYAMRKLIGSDQVSVQFSRRTIPVRLFDRTGNPADPICTDDIAESYDLENGRRGAFSVVDLCHDIVNNTVLAFCCGETDDLFDGIYVASDRHQNEHVYLVLASDLIALCSDIGNDDD